MAEKIIDVAVTAVCRMRAGRPEAPEVLLTRRTAYAHLPLSWELPGGKVEPGEDPRAAACRELHEETGLSVDNLLLLTVVTHAYPDRKVRLHAYLAEAAGGEVTCDHRWTPVASLAAAGLPPANAAINRAIAEHFAKRSAV